MYKARQLSPMLPSFHVEKTCAFFTNLLGFEIARNDSSYVILTKDHTAIHILRAGENIGQLEFYLEVDDVDAVWEQIKNNVEGIKVRPPFNQPYGMREIHIAVPETHALLFIGQEIV